MNKKERTRETVSLFMNIVILGIISLFFYYIWYKYYRDRVYFYQRGNWIILGVYFASLVLFNSIFGGFRLGYAKTRDLIFSQVLALGFANIIVFIETIIARKIILPIRGFLIYYLAEIVITVVINFIANKVYYLFFPARKTVLIYGEDYSAVYEQISRYQGKAYSIQKEILYEEYLKDKTVLSRYDSVMILGLKAQEKEDLIKVCYEKTIPLYIIPDIYEIIVNNARNIYLIDKPIIKANNFGPSQLDKIIKRAFDIFFALVMLVIASPFMLITAIAVKVYDGGPVLYKQVRLTQYGREFKILKFRSMRVDAEKDGKARLASEHDSRITPVGKFIRSCRLDELPQLINILKGDMSVVGPRPERPELVEKILLEVPEFNYRLKVKAGLTGYAQVYGKYNTKLKDKLLFDLYYIENYSMLLDLKIMFLTFKILFVKDSTEGVADDSKN